MRYDNVEWEIIDHPDNKGNSPILDNQSAGSRCPKSGIWFTVAKANSRQYFKQGDIFPDFESDWGDVYWQYDGDK